MVRNVVIEHPPHALHAIVFSGPSLRPHEAFLHPLQTHQERCSRTIQGFSLIHSADTCLARLHKASASPVSSADASLSLSVITVINLKTEKPLVINYPISLVPVLDDMLRPMRGDVTTGPLD